MPSSDDHTICSTTSELGQVPKTGLINGETQACRNLTETDFWRASGKCTFEEVSRYRGRALRTHDGSGGGTVGRTAGSEGRGTHHEALRRVWAATEGVADGERECAFRRRRQQFEHSTRLIYCSVASPRKITRSAYQ